MKKIFKFIYIIIAVSLTSYLCSKFTHIGLSNWYNNLNKPFLTPPNIVFPIVWSIIYTLIVISSFIAMRDTQNSQQAKVNNYFLAQLFLQILWCFIFFAEGYLGLGFAIIVLLDITVFKMISVFTKINKLASVLLYPYYWWLMFATFLNFNYIYNFGLIIVLQ